MVKPCSLLGFHIDSCYANDLDMVFSPQSPHYPLTAVVSIGYDFCICHGHWNGYYWRMNISCLMMKKHQTSYLIPPVILNAGYQLICSKHKAPNLTFYASKTCIFVHFVHMFQLILSLCILFFLQHIPNAIKTISN